jgi:DNA polymerase III subunit chi
LTRVDFYTLAPEAGGDRFLLTCRLVERIHGEGLRILVHAPESDEARHLDRLLWTWRQESFLPHGLVGETDAELTPILITRDGAPESEDQVLINLGLEVPAFFGRFERLCEPLDHDPAVRDAGRRRYAWYRERGYPLQHHSVT